MPSYDFPIKRRTYNMHVQIRLSLPDLTSFPQKSPGSKPEASLSFPHQRAAGRPLLPDRGKGKMCFPSACTKCARTVPVVAQDDTTRPILCFVCRFHPSFIIAAAAIFIRYRPRSAHVVFFAVFRSITKTLKPKLLCLSPVILNRHAGHTGPFAGLTLSAPAFLIKHPAAAPVINGKCRYFSRPGHTRSLLRDSCRKKFFQAADAVIIRIFPLRVEFCPAGSFYFVSDMKPHPILLLLRNCYAEFF